MTVQENLPDPLNADPARSVLLRWFARMFSLAIIGALAVVLALSFAALIYAGPLSAYLGQGAAQMLIGGCVLGICGAVASSIRGAVLGMQDAPAIILALGAGAIAAKWPAGSAFDLFSTVAAMLALTTLAFGATLCLLGRFRLGSIVRYLPYPVIGGFMAATGWFLFVGAISSMTRSPDLGEALSLFMTGAEWRKWGPGVLIGLVLFLSTRVLKSWFALPVVIGLSFAAFYVFLGVSGLSLDWASAEGLLLGPFAETLIADALPTTIVAQADWRAIADQAGFVLTAVAIGIVGMLLNLTGAELSSGQAADADQDLRRTGIANMLSGGLGGGPGYLFISLSLLAQKFGALGRGASAAAGLACGATLVFGASLVSYLPIGVFGGVTAFLGLDLLYQWLWVERKRLPVLDFCIVVTIMIIAATIGFLEGIVAGIAASVGVFVYSCVAAPVVRRAFTNKVKFSTIERPKNEVRILEQFGDETRIYQIQGVLFFGTITKLSSQIASDIERSDARIRRIIIDFAHTQDLDTSAVYGVAKAAADCRRFDIELALSGLNEFAHSRRASMLAPLMGDEGRVFQSLDDALEWAEEATLTRHRETASDPVLEGRELFGDYDGDVDAAIASYFRAERLKRGEALIRQGESDNDLFFLRSGTLVVEINDTEAGRTRVSVQFAGTVIGEMALYTGSVRSADVIAHTDCEVLRLTGAELERMEAEEPQLAICFHRSAARHISIKLHRSHNLVNIMKA